MEDVICGILRYDKRAGGQVGSRRRLRTALGCRSGWTLRIGRIAGGDAGPIAADCSPDHTAGDIVGHIVDHIGHSLDYTPAVDRVAVDRNAVGSQPRWDQGHMQESRLRGPAAAAGIVAVAVAVAFSVGIGIVVVPGVGVAAAEESQRE